VTVYDSPDGQLTGPASAVEGMRKTIAAAVIAAQVRAFLGSMQRR
jgi:hypothetical protein